MITALMLSMSWAAAEPDGPPPPRAAGRELVRLTQQDGKKNPAESGDGKNPDAPKVADGTKPDPKAEKKEAADKKEAPAEKKEAEKGADPSKGGGDPGAGKPPAADFTLATFNSAAAQGVVKKYLETVPNASEAYAAFALSYQVEKSTLLDGLSYAPPAGEASAAFAWRYRPAAGATFTEPVKELVKKFLADTLTQALKAAPPKALAAADRDALVAAAGADRLAAKPSLPLKRERLAQVLGNVVKNPPGKQTLEKINEIVDGAYVQEAAQGGDAGFLAGSGDADADSFDLRLSYRLKYKDAGAAPLTPEQEAEVARLYGELIKGAAKQLRNNDEVSPKAVASLEEKAKDYKFGPRDRKRALMPAKALTSALAAKLFSEWATNPDIGAKTKTFRTYYGRLNENLDVVRLADGLQAGVSDDRSSLTLTWKVYRKGSRQDFDAGTISLVREALRECLKSALVEVGPGEEQRFTANALTLIGEAVTAMKVEQVKEPLAFKDLSTQLLRDMVEEFLKANPRFLDDVDGEIEVRDVRRDPAVDLAQGAMPKIAFRVLQKKSEPLGAEREGRVREILRDVLVRAVTESKDETRKPEGSDLVKYRETVAASEVTFLPPNGVEGLDAIKKAIEDIQKEIEKEREVREEQIKELRDLIGRGGGAGPATEVVYVTKCYTSTEGGRRCLRRVKVPVLVCK